MRWLSIPAELVEDKPLPPGYYWNLEEDDNRFASIRKGQDNDLVIGLNYHAHKIYVVFRKPDGGNREEPADATLEEAVNLIYARFMLGDTQ